MYYIKKCWAAVSFLINTVHTFWYNFEGDKTTFNPCSMTNSWVYILIAIFLHSELSLLISRVHVSNTKAYDRKYKPCDHSMRVSFNLFFHIYVRLSKMLSSCALMSFISLIWTRVHKCALRVFVSHRRKKSYSKVICCVFVCGGMNFVKFCQWKCIKRFILCSYFIQRWSKCYPGTENQIHFRYITAVFHWCAAALCLPLFFLTCLQNHHFPVFDLRLHIHGKL